MAARTGSADLPLHGGRVPHWLAARMSRLGRVVAEAIVHEYGRAELLRRLAQPFWFQSFGAVMGMDWHSSGITTSVIGALKRGLEPVREELGVHFCGGRGRHGRRTPDELRALGERRGLDAEALIQASRLVAKVDSAAVLDGFGVYLHGFVVTDEGDWAVVQQGMRPETRQARRYHWLSEGLASFVEEPHVGIEGEGVGAIVNLTDHRAALSRAGQLELVREGPDRVLATLRKLADAPAPRLAPAPHLQMPAHHEVRATDVLLRRLRGTLAAAAERGPRDFAELLLMPGLGPRSVEALAFVAEVIHGAPSRFSDPARYSLALGGKDGHPFPVPLLVYDETIRLLKVALENARLGNDERLAAIRRLDAQARRLERTAAAPSFEAHLAHERASSQRCGGRVASARRPGGARRGHAGRRASGQLALF
jgi:hypothetical protein